jgi:hypothetical protein
VMGGLVAAHWVTKEDKEINNDNTNDND